MTGPQAVIGLEYIFVALVMERRIELYMVRMFWVLTLCYLEGFLPLHPSPPPQRYYSLPQGACVFVLFIQSRLRC
jgi:hypothetical protein